MRRVLSRAVAWRGAGQWNGCLGQWTGQWQRPSMARAWSTAPPAGPGGATEEKPLKEERRGSDETKEKSEPLDERVEEESKSVSVEKETKGEGEEVASKEKEGENEKEGEKEGEKGKEKEKKVPFWVTFRQQPLYVQAYWALTVVATFVLVKEKVFDDPFWYSTKKRAREEIVKINESNVRFGPPDEGPRLDLSSLTTAEKDALRRKALQKKLAKLREGRGEKQEQ